MESLLSRSRLFHSRTLATSNHSALTELEFKAHGYSGFCTKSLESIENVPYYTRVGKQENYAPSRASRPAALCAKCGEIESFLKQRDGTMDHGGRFASLGSRIGSPYGDPEI